MSTSTTNYNLEKPTDDEFAEISVINANMDIIDTKIKTLDDVKEGLIKNAAEKTDMADVDALPMVDSVDSSKTKRITFANLKAILKAYFDTLYNKTIMANNLMATAEGSALDAVQGKVLDDKISTVNTSLSEETTARANADALKANLASPNLTGTPTISSNIIYHVGNITCSTVAPSVALAEGAQHQVY